MADDAMQKPELSAEGKKALADVREVVFESQHAENVAADLATAIAVLFGLPIDDANTLVANDSAIGRNTAERIETVLNAIEELRQHLSEHERPFHMSRMPAFMGQRDAKEGVRKMLTTLNAEVHSKFRAETMRSDRMHNRGEEGQFRL